MAVGTGTYNPDYSVAPGSVLAELLEARDLPIAEFARRCGSPVRLISEIIAGEAPVEPEIAIQFERVLGLDASVWLSIEAEYRSGRAARSGENEARRRAEA